MSSIDNPLTRVLSQGAELAVAKQIANGANAAESFFYIKSRWKDLDDSQATSLLDTGRAIAFVAKELNGRNRSEQISPAMVPLNPNMLGGKDGGIRARVVGQLRDPKTGRFIEARIKLADLPSVEQIFRELADMIRDIRKRYPDAYKDATLPEDDEIEGEIIAIERGF